MGRVAPVLTDLQKFRSTFGQTSQAAFELQRKLATTKSRLSAGILAPPKCGQPPATVLHREGIKNRDVLSGKGLGKLSALLRRHGGIQQDHIVGAAFHKCGRNGLRSFERQFTAEFLKRFQNCRAPRPVSAHEQNRRARYGRGAARAITRGGKLIERRGNVTNCCYPGTCGHTALPSRAGRGNPEETSYSAAKPPYSPAKNRSSESREKVEDSIHGKLGLITWLQGSSERHSQRNPA